MLRQCRLKRQLKTNETRRGNEEKTLMVGDDAKGGERGQTNRRRNDISPMMRKFLNLVMLSLICLWFGSHLFSSLKK